MNLHQFQPQSYFYRGGVVMHFGQVQAEILGEGFHHLKLKLKKISNQDWLNMECKWMMCR
jgi:hypothetical protein